MSTGSGLVKPIDKISVHKICSGQVILSLSTAVKELVENGLDAGANTIEIRVKEFGKDGLEVIDNGCGVEPVNFKSLTLKHHTSKLREFSDLIDVETFGFRGEALSSLCALSDLNIVTRHKTLESGTKIDYDHNGKIANQVPCARQVGTTVSLKNLFKTLPVRHNEFIKNVKKEFNKMAQVLYSYCLIRPDVKFNCTNTSNSKRTVLFNTTGNQDLNGTITNLFGHQQAKNLKEFHKENPTEELLTEFGINDNSSCSLFKISGFLSICEHGQGRSTTDRQFYYINKRPCDNSKINRIVNEVYHQFNRHQYPFVILDISFVKDSVDVNVTPDKRQIFVQNEKFLLATLKMSLHKLYSSSTSDLCTSLQNQTKIVNKEKVARDSPVTNTFNHAKRAFLLENNMTPNQKAPKQLKLGSFSFPNSKTPALSLFDKASDQPNIHNFLTPPISKRPSKGLRKFSYIETIDVPKCSTDEESLFEPTRSLEILKEINNLGETQREKPLDNDSLDAKVPDEECGRKSPNKEKDSAILTVFDENEEFNRKTVNLNLSYSKIVSICREKENMLESCGDVKNWKFKAKITPEDNKKAESELQKAISKDMFDKMEILFQFNLGFIIAKLNSDLFIIDQHASEEKYNFEMLQKNGTLQTQKLILPQPLNLTMVNESILKDNIEIFQKNGFDFQFDDDDKPLLISIPVNKNWTFGKEDIDELIFMLSDSPGVMCRPSRVQKMFASQACRKSVMIGTGLNRSNMKKLVKHMGEIEQPWNCPHGRPTIRHLINLDMINS